MEVISPDSSDGGTPHLETNEEIEDWNDVNSDHGVHETNDDGSSADLPNIELGSNTRQSPEREPPAKERKLSNSAEKRKRRRSDDEDGATCSICLEVWSNSGDHRLASLKCGHLFGRSCVVRWLKSQQTSEKCCPTCKTKAAIKDIRCIFARKLVAVDLSEIEAMKQMLDSANSEKNRAELELQKSLMNQKLYLKQLADLREIFRKCEGELKSQQAAVTRNIVKNYRFALEKNMELGREADSRVMGYNCRKYELCISSKSANALFPGYGVKKINCLDFKFGSFTFLHSKAIRDLSYSQPNDMLLSASLDKTAKLVSGQNSNVVNTINCDIPLWSCCWDYFIPQKLYVGGPSGLCYQYDIRQTGSYVEKFQLDSDMSPVISLASTQDGFISCRLNSCSFYCRDNEGRFNQTPIPLQGPFSSLNYDSKSKQVLISTRPSQQNMNAKHILCNIDLSKDMLTDFNIVHTFFGSTVQSVMSKSCQIEVDNEHLIAAYHETESAVCIYSVNNMNKIQSLKSHENTILDLCSFAFNGESFLAALSQNKLKVYKAVVAS